MSAYIPLAPFYDELTRDVPYSAFADLYEEVFAEYGISAYTILDLGCGTGTLTCILAERGHEMIGTDYSEEMLSEAQEKCWEREFDVRPMFLHQSMTELDLYGTVNAAVSSLDSLNYVAPEDISEVFRRLRLFIEPGGALVFDVNRPEWFKSLDGQVFVDETDDVFCVWRADFSNDKLTYGMDIFSRAGSTWSRRQEEHIEYAHSIDFLKEKLRDNGFGEIKTRTLAGSENRVFISARRM
ncbi:MAG: class I SAM-dependent methyltransferase [Oscillospiraceae bacterium]|nr:class I SAM-dependent methyltransferase [Oscillospiraceae bacterium]